ncbi:helix-turn-helix transcriptional regulator [Legionella spiritensis]|uniref:helix-turn-helix transcriptional regulator n=1 Tax=Legionella spiritensis TaxID=452 RepID=UPI000F6D29BC|nr:AlpA family phage regulatory protein [Legionella spiritensis]VEG91211.1 prophage regulatory protein-like protein [Legionella spiritensis]
MANTEFKQQILFIKDVERLIGRNRNTLRRWWLTGKFPRPVKIHDSLLTWHYGVVENWINQTLNINE